MGGLSLQRRVAADILKVGTTKIWMDTDHLEDIKNAITRSDIRKAISHGYIKVRPDKIRRSKLNIKKKKKGPGRRKGAKKARYPKKRKWINTIRPLRAMIKDLRDQGKIDPSTYRKIYYQLKGGAFRSRSHLKLYLQQRGILNEENKI